jgi:hypothetical protein
LADYLNDLRRAAGQSTAGAAANQMEALHRAVSAAREEREHPRADREQESFQSIERVREFADRLRVSEQRITDLEAGLQAERDRAQRELRAAAERAEQAQARLAAEASRADAAERTAREAEDRLNEILSVIQEEFAAGRAGG